MIKLDEKALNEFKQALRENTKQLEKLTEQVKQIAQATNLWNIPQKSLDTSLISEPLPTVLEEKPTDQPKTVLFVCVDNAGLSQMAADLFCICADLTKASAISAGSEPASNVHPNVLKVMEEVGCYNNYVPPRRLTEELAAQADLFISMGCEEHEYPIYPVETLDWWQFENPKDQSIEKVRQIRDQIEKKVLNLLTERGWIREGLNIEIKAKETENDAFKKLGQYLDILDGSGNGNNCPTLAEIMEDQYWEQVEHWHKRIGNISIDETLQTPHKMIVPENIKELIMWGYNNLPVAFKRLAFTDNISISMLAGNILYTVGSSANIPLKYKVAYNQFQFYAMGDQLTMIQQVLNEATR
jgi:arsenate reductase (thioredoxin)